jgi:hypothetical protein
MAEGARLSPGFSALRFLTLPREKASSPYFSADARNDHRRYYPDVHELGHRIGCMCICIHAPLLISYTRSQQQQSLAFRYEEQLSL